MNFLSNELREKIEKLPHNEQALIFYLLESLSKRKSDSQLLSEIRSHLKQKLSKEDRK